MVSQVAISTYREVLEVVSEASEWADPYELEAIAAEAFDAYAGPAPDLCAPYGAGFGVIDMNEVSR